MDYRKITALFCGLAMVGCQQVHHIQKPKNLIPEKKMVNILVDLAKTNAAISINANEYKKRGVVPKKLIFKKYGIDSLQLVKSNAYYADHFKLNKRLYREVKAKLQHEVDSLTAVIKAEEKKKKLKVKKEKTEAPQKQP